MPMLLGSVHRDYYLTHELDAVRVPMYQRGVSENYSHEFKVQVEDVFNVNSQELVNENIIVRSLCGTDGANSNSYSNYSWLRAADDILENPEIHIFLAVRKGKDGLWINVGFVNPDALRAIASSKI